MHFIIKYLPIHLVIVFVTLFTPLAATEASLNDAADTYFSTQGFYTDEGFQWSVELPNHPGVFIESQLGGIAAPMAFYQGATQKLTSQGLSFLRGDTGTFSRPEIDSALGYRTQLFPITGVQRLKAFYTDAISAFTLRLDRILIAEAYFRQALRVNPYYREALDGLLECYYARAEGFMLIGNDYAAKAYRHKFERDVTETDPIVVKEVAYIQSALKCYEIGFREFMKLFNSEFTDVNGIRQPHLDFDAQWLFFEPRFVNSNDPGGPLVSFESLRGQKNTIGVSTQALNDIGGQVGPVQGSPNFEVTIMDSSVSMLRTQANENAALDSSSMQVTALSNVNQWNAVDAPVKFQSPTVVGISDYTPGGSFTLQFRVDVNDAFPIKTLKMVIEYDTSKLIVDTANIDDSGSAFSENMTIHSPDPETNTLVANQILIELDAPSSLSGTDLSVVKVPFQIKSIADDGSLLAGTDLYIYAAGSGDPLLSGYKDVAVLYRLAAAHADATAEIIRRQYIPDDETRKTNCINLIQEETHRIGGWYEHLQALLAIAANPVQLENIAPLQGAINAVASELSGLSAQREFIRSGANVFGYPKEYVPFYNVGDSNTFDAIRSLVVGSSSGFSPESCSGFFGIARNAETNAVRSYGKLLDTKDRIRGEIFTINQQAESRLIQICGRITSDGQLSLDVNDPIDYDLQVSSTNLACEIGQHALLLKRAMEYLRQANADIAQYLEDIELEENALEDVLQQHANKTQVMAEYSALQQNKDREIAGVIAQQTRLNAVVQATTTVLNASSSEDFIFGGAFAAGVSAAVQLANGMVQANLEEKKGELAAAKTQLAAEERIALTDIDSEIFKIQQTKIIEQMVNNVVLKNIAAQIAEIDVQLALGKLNQLIIERDELLARRGRALANLGEMSFADPTFRLTQCNTMKDAETHLEFLKKWLYLMTRALYYKWALPEDYQICDQDLGCININNINEIQTIGILNGGTDGFEPLDDELTAADYVTVLLAYHDTSPIDKGLSPTFEIKTPSSRYSLREDFLRIVRTERTDAETMRVRSEFNAWLNAPERFDDQGNLVIEFNTVAHLEGLDDPVNENHGTWQNFALRSYSDRPLWNHKITRIGVALSAYGNAFSHNSRTVSGSIEFGGTGYIKGDSDLDDDFMAYQMRQWLNRGSGRLEPVDVRTVALEIPSSAAFQETDMVYNLKERPVTSTLWRLKILKSQLVNINMENIQDIHVYIYSEAFQRQ